MQLEWNHEPAILRGRQIGESWTAIALDDEMQMQFVVVRLDIALPENPRGWSACVTHKDGPSVRYGMPITSFEQAEEICIEYALRYCH